MAISIVRDNGAAPPAALRARPGMTRAASFLRPEAYAFLLDQAATTGYLPRLDRFGRPILDDQRDELAPKERVQLLEHLLEKTLPAAKAAPPEQHIDPFEILENPGDLQTMTGDALARLAQGTPQINPDDVVDVQFTPAEDPGGPVE